MLNYLFPFLLIVKVYANGVNIDGHDKKSSDTSRLAEWILKLAKKRGLSAAKLAKALKVSSSYFVKLKRGDIAKFPFEKMENIVTLLGVSEKDIYEIAGVQCSNFGMSHLKVESTHDEPLYNRPPDRLKFVFHEGVPDHCWPLIALKKNFFKDVNIEIDVSRNPLSSYPKSHQICAKEGKNDTLFIMPLSSMETPEFTNVTPVAISHVYHGYPFIGRNPSPIEPLPEFPTTNQFETLIWNLDSRDIFESKCVASISNKELDFLEQVLFLVKQCPRSKRITYPDRLHFGDIPRSSSISFLDELWEIGNCKRDFMVGHAMSLAIALKNPERYKVIFDFKRIESVIDLAMTEADSDIDSVEKKKKLEDLRDIKDTLNTLILPVTLVLNTNANYDDSKHNGLVCRLSSVVKRTAEHVLKNISDNISEEILEKMRFPASSIGDKIPDADCFRKAWQRCYSFDSFAVNYKQNNIVKSLIKKLAKTDAKMSEDKTKSEEALLKLANTSIYYNKIKTHLDNYNYYDACICAEEAMRSEKEWNNVTQ